MNIAALQWMHRSINSKKQLSFTRSLDMNKDNLGVSSALTFWDLKVVWNAQRWGCHAFRQLDRTESISSRKTRIWRSLCWNTAVQTSFHGISLDHHGIKAHIWQQLNIETNMNYLWRRGYIVKRYTSCKEQRSTASRFKSWPSPSFWCIVLEMPANLRQTWASNTNKFIS